MTSYKISTNSESHGVSVHNDLRKARESQKKHGAKYKIFHWIGKVEKGRWEEMR